MILVVVQLLRFLAQIARRVWMSAITTHVANMTVSCPELSRVAQSDSGRSERNVYGLVPTVPSCPESNQWDRRQGS